MDSQRPDLSGVQLAEQLTDWFRQPVPISVSEIGSGQSNFYEYCLNDPVNRVDPSGLQDVVVFGEVDVVPIIGAELAAGYVFDIDNPTETGHFLSGGTGAGLNLGAAVGVGYYARGAEGKSINYDFNFVVFSITLTYDKIGLHGGTITYGPGAGWSKSETNTKKTITLKDILSFFTNDDGCE